MHYNYESLNGNGGKAFLDTGTTFVYVSQPFFRAIVTTFDDFCGQQKSNCAGNLGHKECYHFNPVLFPTTYDFLKTFPSFEFKFAGNAAIKWLPQDYFVKMADNNAYLCIGIKTLKDMILGALFMRNYDVSFEKSGKKIMFTRSSCGKSDFVVPSNSYDQSLPNIKIAVDQVSKIFKPQKPENLIQETFLKPKIDLLKLIPENLKTEIGTQKVEVEKSPEFENQSLKKLRKTKKSKMVSENKKGLKFYKFGIVWITLLLVLVLARTLLFDKKSKNYRKEIKRRLFKKLGIYKF